MAFKKRFIRVYLYVLRILIIVLELEQIKTNILLTARFLRVLELQFSVDKVLIQYSLSSMYSTPILCQCNVLFFKGFHVNAVIGLNIPTIPVKI